MKNKMYISKRIIGAYIVAFILVVLAIVVYFKMDKPTTANIELKKINEHVWLMNENNEATGYVVVGEKQAAVIDTMNGYGNVKETVETITKLPLIVINTHGHGDHIYGNAYFGEAYLSPDDFSLAKESYAYSTYTVLASHNHFEDVNFLEMKEGDVFDLGGITLEAYALPGHSAGSMCLLDKEDRILFTGDAINRHCWMQLPCSLSMDKFYTSLENLGKIRGDYDYILHGHAQAVEDASLYDELLAAVKEVRDGVNDGDTDYEYFGGICKQHPFPKGEGVVVYNEKE